jgi:hypothetical protein
LEQGSKIITSVSDIEGSTNKISLLGSSYARKIRPMLGDMLGKKLDIVSILKPNVPVANVVEDLSKLGKNSTK